MGTNASIKFPAGTRMKDVANATGILLGCTKKWTEAHNTRWIDVAGVTQTTSSIPEMAYINIQLKDVDNPAARAIRESDGDIYALTYHFEGEHDGPTILPKSTAAKIALGKALVSFFGGSADYNDSDSVDVNIRVSPRKPIAPTNGKAWDDFQKALDELKPLTEKEIAAAERYAAY